MMATAHSSTASLSNSDNLARLDVRQQRRMNVSASPVPSPLNLPEPIDLGRSRRHSRSPSPLRNGHTPDAESEDGSDQEDDDHDTGWGRGRSTHSPSSSVTKFAATFAQRVGSFMGPARSPQMLPTDAELEAEAERERERSRREAERIIAMERMKVDDRMTVEERVMAMLQSNDSRSPPVPIPQRSQSTAPNNPSPTASQKEKSGWWATTKNKLTPTKEPLTPAQQVVQDTKSRDKERQKEKKYISKGKDKEKSKDWPSLPERKYSDPAFLNLAIPSTPSAPRAISASPSSSSPTPARYSNPPSLAPSPLRAADATSPSKTNPPLYAQFNSEGVLDVPATLLTIAKRFEKLEKWTVGHVRALEDRMDDVERWLVDKEKEKEKQGSMTSVNGDPIASHDMADLREELAELQGRVGEIGREMAKLAVPPGNLSSGPSRSSTSLARAPSTVSSIAIRTMTTSPPRTYPASSHTKEPTSPPMAPLVPVLTGSRTRLPYPTGDYATPPETVAISQGHFSPTNSPPSSLSGAPRPIAFSGLPSGPNTPASSVSGLPRSVSPVNNMSPFTGRSPSASLPAPKFSDPRPSSVSPTPRKRYTVALGGPIMSADRRTSPPPVEPTQLGTAFFSSPTTDEESDEFQDETVGKSAGRRSELSSLDRDARHRSRPQSTYGGASASIAPLQPRLRSQSVVGLGISEMNGNGKFVDPLVTRRQEKDGPHHGPKKVLPKRGKKAVGDLVAFFDGSDK